ncbi:MAG TPA: hypothetical protein VG937_23925 [Polyangiaceae bacterium]|jgi:hypothetical protein|nr:hypothetical protein [Polyangiaceae bacterium]
MENLEARTTKSFLQRPEGKVGLALTLVATALGGYGLFLVLPTLIVFATNVIHLAALCALLGGVLYLALDHKIRALFSYAYRAFWRWAVGLLIELDPIGILRGHIRELGQKLAAMREQLASLRAQIRQIERSMQDNLAMRDDAMGLALTSRQSPEHAAAGRLQARHAVKLEESNTNLGAMLTQMQTLFRMLKKLHDASELVLSDMQSTVDIKSRERASMNAAYSAYRSAFAILQGQSEGREIYDRTLEFLNEDYARKLGEIELFMDFSDGLIKGADLQSLAFDMQANHKLDEWEARLSSSLLGGASKAPLASAKEASSLDPLERLLDRTDPEDRSSRRVG